MRGRFGLFGFLGILLFALVVGGIGYAIGVGAGQAQVAPGGVVYPVGYVHSWGFGFGFPLFGLFFVFVLFALIFSAFRARRWGGPGGWGRGYVYGHGPGHGYGPGGFGGPVDPNDPRAQAWGGRDVPPAFRPMLESWHRQAHGDAVAGSDPSAQAGTTGTPSDGPASR